jgi:colanic acid biosynthesis glycosyl transferase WcaI
LGINFGSWWQRVSNKMAEKNFVILTSNFAPEFTGIAVHTSDIAIELNKKGYHVSVFTAFPYYPDWKINKQYRHQCFVDEKYFGVNVYRNWLFVPSNKKQIVSILRILHEISFVLLQFFHLMIHFRVLIKAKWIMIFSPPFIQGVTSLILSKFFKKSVILHIEDIQPDSAINLKMISGKKTIFVRYLQIFEKLFYKNATIVSTLTEGMRKNILSKFDSDYKKVILLPYWVNFNEFRMDNDARNRFRKQQSSNGASILIGYAGNIGKKQKIEYLVDIAKELQNDQNIHFIIAGEGAEKNKIKNLLKNNRLKNVTMIDLLSGQEYVDFLNGIDLAYISQDERVDQIFIPSKLFKTLSCGTPVLCIADQNSELANIVRNFQSGYIKSFSDFDDIIKLIKSLKNNRKELQKYRKNAYRNSRVHYDKDGIMNGFLKEIEDLQL